MNILLYLFKFTAIGLCSCSKTSKTLELLNAVQTNISAYIKPGLDTDEPVVVNVTFDLVALTELNEVKGYISTIGYFEVTWIDDRISWATEDYEGVSWKSVDARKVWIPKVIVTNPSEKLYTLHDIPTGELPVPGRPTIWIIVGQGPTALAVGAGGGCLDIFTLIFHFPSLSPSLWETARYRLKYCLKGPLNPKQPTNQTHRSGVL